MPTRSSNESRSDNANESDDAFRQTENILRISAHKNGASVLNLMGIYRIEIITERELSKRYNKLVINLHPDNIKKEIHSEATVCMERLTGAVSVERRYAVQMRDKGCKYEDMSIPPTLYLFHND